MSEPIKQCTCGLAAVLVGIGSAINEIEPIDKKAPFEQEAVNALRRILKRVAENVRLLARIAELEAGQDEGVRRDAERYRWLRDHSYLDSWTDDSEEELEPADHRYGPYIDHAVDAAIAAAKEQK